METACNRLCDTLQYQFTDADLLQQALTHRSADKANYERLEFLGDAVLELVVTEALYIARPDVLEGDLSKLRASLVKADTLAELARDMGIGDCLILGGGERKSGGHRRGSILADALEAVFGAVYVDGGFEAAQKVIENVYERRLRNLPDLADLRDPKTRLQEWLQAQKMPLPDYELSGVAGKEHARRFTVICSVADVSVFGEGESTTRQKAEQLAARRMLRLLMDGR